MSLMTRLANWIVAKSALYDLHPELEDRVHLLSVSSEDQAESGADSQFRQNATNYTRHMWLQKAVNVLANNIAPLSVRVVRGSGADTEYLDDHPVSRLLDAPNPDMSPEEFWRAWVTDQMLGGEWGVEVVRSGSGALVELWPRQPDQFTVRAKSVRYRQVAAYRIDDGYGKPYDVDPENFIHIKFYNPLSPFRGIAPATAIQLSIAIDQLSQAWSKLFFKNNARPDFAVIAPEGVTPSEKAEILEKLRADHRGRPHEPLVLENGITDIKVFSFPAKDLEWISQREMSRDEVAAIVGVPDEIMGYGRDTYENFATAEKVLWRLTIVPLCGFRDGALTRYFRRVGLIGPDERIETDLRNVPQLQEDKSEAIVQAKTLFDMGVPVNVISDYLNLGLPKIPGGDIGYLNSAMVPVDQLPVSGGLRLGLLGGQPAQTKGAVERADTEYGSPEHEAIYKRLQSRLSSPVAALQRIIKKEFQRQQTDILARLKNSKTYGRGRFKADGESVPSPNELFDLEAEVTAWVNALKARVTEAVAEIGQLELDELGLAVAFDITRPEVVRQIAHILETVARRTNETTWTDLVELFEEAERAGEGVVAIQERLSAYFGDRKSDYQTERIARTTMVGASNSGQQQAWNQAEEEGVQLAKRWISALQPDRTREAHAEAHNQTVGLHEMFVVGGEELEYPGDPNGSPGNIINCLCGMVAEVKE